MYTVIIQQAIKHFSGIYLMSENTNSTVQWEDTAGNVVQMSGGNEYLKRTVTFPGIGCEDYTLTHMNTEEEIGEKILWYTPSGSLKPIKDFTYEEISEAMLVPYIPAEVLKYLVKYLNHEVLNAQDPQDAGTQQEA